MNAVFRSAQDVDQLGKRHAIDFLVSTGAGGQGGGGGMEGGEDMSKRARHTPM